MHLFGVLTDHLHNKLKETQVIYYLRQSLYVSIHKEEMDISVCVRYLILTELLTNPTGELKLILMMMTFGLVGNKNIAYLIAIRMLFQDSQAQNTILHLKVLTIAVLELPGLQVEKWLKNTLMLVLMLDLELKESILKS